MEENKFLQQQIDDLKRRIEVLEQRPIYYPVYPVQPQCPPSVPTYPTWSTFSYKNT